MCHCSKFYNLWKNHFKVSRKNMFPRCKTRDSISRSLKPSTTFSATLRIKVWFHQIKSEYLILIISAFCPTIQHNGPPRDINNPQCSSPLCSERMMVQLRQLWLYFKKYYYFTSLNNVQMYFLVNTRIFHNIYLDQEFKIRCEGTWTL